MLHVRGTIAGPRGCSARGLDHGFPGARPGAAHVGYPPPAGSTARSGGRWAVRTSVVALHPGPQAAGRPTVPVTILRWSGQQDVTAAILRRYPTHPPDESHEPTGRGGIGQGGRHQGVDEWARRRATGAEHVDCQGHQGQLLMVGGSVLGLSGELPCLVVGVVASEVRDCHSCTFGPGVGGPLLECTQRHVPIARHRTG